MYTWFIARRLFSQSPEVKRVSKPAIRIATLGVAVGIAVMLVSVCIVLGFQKEIRDKVFGFGSHAQVLNDDSYGASEYKPIVISDSIIHVIQQIPDVNHVQKFCMKTGMLKTDVSFKGIALRGYDKEFDDTFLKKHLVDGKMPNFSSQEASNQILISSRTASQLKLKVGDKVYAYFFDQTVKARRLLVSGIYCTNLTDFDNSLIFTDDRTVRSILNFAPEQYSGAEITLDDYNKLDEVMPQLISHINRRQDTYGAYYTTVSVHELYPQVFSWLKLLDLDVWVILILMVCVAGFTMVSGLLIIILERTNFIGIMKALGSTNTSLRGIFLSFGSLIILRGLIFGDILAFALVLVQKTTGIIHLDSEVYYVDSVPLLINWGWMLVVNVCTLIASVLALIIPSYLVSNIHPATSIRFE